MNFSPPLPLQLTRRAFLGRSGAGMGMLALASLLKPEVLGAEGRSASDRWDGIVRPLHLVPKAKRVIYLYMAGGPAMGSWVLYGLGSDSDNLPGFVVLTSTGKAGQQQPISSRQWHSGFLPSRFQGEHFRSKGDPVLYVGNPHGVTADRQRDVV